LEFYFIKNVQNEISKHFSVGNTFRQATMHARMTWWHELGLWLNQDAIWEKRYNNAISEGVSVLLGIYTDWKKNQTIENVR